MQVFLIDFNRFRLGFAGFLGFRRPLLIFAQGNLHHHLTADFGNLAIERTYTGFTGVITDDIAYRAFFDHQFAFFHSVAFHLLRHEILHGDIDFFVFGIAGQTDDFHAVEQWSWNVQTVRCSNKHYIAQVVIHFGIMIGKLVVLLRIEHLKQRAGRVAAEVAAQFVDFVEQEQGILHACFSHVLQDFAGHRADIGAAVSTDFAFVAHAAQSHADIFPACCFGDGFAQGGFTHPRRTNQT